MLQLKDRGEAYDPLSFDQCVANAVDATVSRQVTTGIDLVSDGEMSKISYATYLKDRLNGFDGTATENRAASDLLDYIAFARRLVEQGGTERSLEGPACSGPLSVRDDAPLQKDLANFSAAVKTHQPTGGFLTASSPGVVSVFLQNQYYPDDDAYLEALAECLKAGVSGDRGIWCDIATGLPGLGYGPSCCASKEDCRGVSPGRGSAY